MSFFERLETQDGWQAFWRPVMAYCMASYGAGVVLLLFWRRGVAEMVIGAAMGPPLSFFMLIGPSMVSSISVGFWRSLSWRAWPSLTAIVLIGAITGAMAGLAYWLAIGRPQNPRAR